MDESEGRPKTAAQALGREIREWRRHLGITQERLADEAGYTRSYAAMVESGERLASEQYADACDRLFKTPGTIARLRRRANQSGYPEWFEPYVELEHRASRIRAFQSQVVPGYLQTEDYARSMLVAVRPVDLEDLVSARMARHYVLEQDTPPQVWLILDEQVLRRTIGGPRVMAAQLQHLLTAASNPTTVIQVIPEAVAAHAGLAGPFTLLSFTDASDVLYVDGHSQGRMGYDREEVARAEHSYDLLRAVALSPEASADVISGHLEGLK